VTGEPQLVPLVSARSDYLVLDPAIAEDVATIKALHPGDFTLTSRDRADRKWVVSFTVDDGPMSYYLYDRETRSGKHLFDSQPALRNYPLAKMEPFAYEARDGLRIEGYLSFPPGAGRENLPAVIAPHGGPWERDLWRFNTRIQFLATRGYLVVSPNYRGSCGYGTAHVNAGDKEWGGAMHDDLIDAIDHVVARGYADPARIGIMGGSYGGYAALVGAAFTPERFRCAVALYGPSSLVTMRENDAAWLQPLHALMSRRIGDPETEAAFLWSRSPLSRVDQIRIPLLIAQGANDARVSQAESDRIVAALKERGIPHEYLVFPDEGHGFVKPENNLTLYRRVEAFLAEHLGGRQSA
jgi:dipeptidyl aminopeptidase/acylaminoacyl peptidase